MIYGEFGNNYFTFGRQLYNNIFFFFKAACQIGCQATGNDGQSAPEAHYSEIAAFMNYMGDAAICFVAD